jgi:hypothetical protein
MPDVSPEMIGLLGVVIGALLGGGAQLLAGWLQEGRRHQQWLRERRAAIYQDFLSEAGKKLSALGDYFDFHYHSTYEPPEDYLVVVYQRAEEVGLFGTTEAHQRAKGAADALSKLLNGTQKDSTERYLAAEAALTSFRLQARNDLLKPGQVRVGADESSS